MRVQGDKLTCDMRIHIRYMRIQRRELAGDLIVDVREMRIVIVDIGVDVVKSRVIGVNNSPGQVVVAEVYSFVNRLRGDIDDIHGDACQASVTALAQRYKGLLAGVLRGLSDIFRDEENDIGGQDHGCRYSAHVTTIRAGAESVSGRKRGRIFRAQACQSLELPG